MSSISGVGASGATLQGLSGPSNAGRSAAPAAAATEGASLQVSGRGKFLGRVQELLKTDPAQGKQMLSDLADRLQSQAAGGGAAAPAKLALADRVRQAASSGDLSELLRSHASAKAVHSGPAGAYARTAAMATTRSSM